MDLVLRLLDFTPTLMDFMLNLVVFILRMLDCIILGESQAEVLPLPRLRTRC